MTNRDKEIIERLTRIEEKFDSYLENVCVPCRKKVNKLYTMRIQILAVIAFVSALVSFITPILAKVLGDK